MNAKGQLESLQNGAGNLSPATDPLGIFSKFSKNPRKDKWYNVEFKNLMYMSLNLFKWTGFEDIFPDMPENFIEQMLFLHYGSVVVYKDNFGLFRIAIAQPDSLYNMYWQSDSVYAYYPNSILDHVQINDVGKKKAEGVLIQSKVSMWDSDYDIVEQYAGFLAEIDVSSEVNTVSVRNPIVMTGDRLQQEDMEALKEAVITGENFIQVGGKSTNTLNGVQTEVKSLTSNVPYTVTTLLQTKAQLISEALTMMGINSAGAMQKKERAIAGEIDSNNEQIALNLQNKLRMRQQAAEKMNKMFGWNIKVEAQDITGGEVEGTTFLKHERSISDGYGEQGGDLNE